MGLLRYLRGDDLLDEHSESRALPPAENQLPLLGAYTSSAVTPTVALAIGDPRAAGPRTGHTARAVRADNARLEERRHGAARRRQLRPAVRQRGRAALVRARCRRHEPADVQARDERPVHGRAAVGGAPDLDAGATRVNVTSSTWPSSSRERRATSSPWSARRRWATGAGSPRWRSSGRECNRLRNRAYKLRKKALHV